VESFEAVGPKARAKLIPMRGAKNRCAERSSSPAASRYGRREPCPSIWLPLTSDPPADMRTSSTDDGIRAVVASGSARASPAAATSTATAEA